MSGVHAKLTDAMKAGAQVELHVARVLGRGEEENFLLAMKESNGRLSKIDWTNNASASTFLDLGSVVLWVGGILCILTILGAPVGAMCFVHASRLTRFKKRITVMRTYLRNLHGAVAL